jgi:hypothetical protein
VGVRHRPGGVPALQVPAIGPIDGTVRDDEQRRARRDRSRGVGDAGQCVAERERAGNRAHRAQELLHRDELSLSLGDPAINHGLGALKGLLALHGLQRCSRLPRRFALSGGRGLGFLERRRQRLGLEPFGFEVGGRAVAFRGDQRLDARPFVLELGAGPLALGGERLIHVLAQTRGGVACRQFELLAQSGRGVRGRLLQLGAKLRG